MSCQVIREQPRGLPWAVPTPPRTVPRRGENRTGRIGPVGEHHPLDIGTEPDPSA